MVDDPRSKALPQLVMVALTKEVHVELTEGVAIDNYRRVEIDVVAVRRT